MLTSQDIQVLRDLAQQYAQIAALPVHAQKRKLWQDNNECRSARPLVLIDQICWWELDSDPFLTAQVQEPYWRKVEIELRKKIYCWRYMPVDMVFNPYISIPKPSVDSGWGLDAIVDTKALDSRAGVRSKHYHHVLKDYEDLDKIQMPEYSLDEEQLRKIREEAEVIFEGIIPYCMKGISLQLGVWDRISNWMGVQNCYMELMDRPEFIHAIMQKLIKGLISQVESLNRQGLYDVTSGMVHCNHTYLDDLPAADSDKNFGTSNNGWGYGQAQLFTACSPQITKEFEVEYMQQIHPYFGAVYYGCCERLDDRLDIIAKLDRVRKISCSPWSDHEHFAEALPPHRVMSAKPSPAFLAGSSFDEEQVRKDLRKTIDAAKRYNRNLELILKDISTIRNDPSRLWRWAEIAMEEVQR